MRVVIVDDSEDLRLLLSLVLGPKGHEVVGEATDGAQAVAVVEAHQPDWVILDQALPVVSGLEALPDIHAACPSARIVMFTSHPADELRGAALAGGAVAEVEKPAGAGAVVAALEALPA